MFHSFLLFVVVLSGEPKQNQGRGLVDRKLVQAPSNFIAGRPKAALLFWFFDGFRYGMWLCLVFLGAFIGSPFNLPVNRYEVGRGGPKKQEDMREKDISIEISELEKGLTQEEIDILENLKAELYELRKRNVKGAVIRSRAFNILNEKPAKYFVLLNHITLPPKSYQNL